MFLDVGERVFVYVYKYMNQTSFHIATRTTFAPNREAFHRYLLITKAVILMRIARARCFALWHVVISQATGTGAPLRMFQTSPADRRGICSKDSVQMESLCDSEKRRKFWETEACGIYECDDLN